LSHATSSSCTRCTCVGWYCGRAYPATAGNRRRGRSGARRHLFRQGWVESQVSHGLDRVEGGMGGSVGNGGRAQIFR
jgi:hypothetical protein